MGCFALTGLRGRGRAVRARPDPTIVSGGGSEVSEVSEDSDGMGENFEPYWKIGKGGKNGKSWNFLY